VSADDSCCSLKPFIGHCTQLRTVLCFHIYNYSSRSRLRFLLRLIDRRIPFCLLGSTYNDCVQSFGHTIVFSERSVCCLVDMPAAYAATLRLRLPLIGRLHGLGFPSYGLLLHMNCGTKNREYANICKSKWNVALAKCAVGPALRNILMAVNYWIHSISQTVMK
jgi:hypothetical protein